MNEATIQVVLDKVIDLGRILKTLEGSISSLREREKQVDKAKEIIARKESSISRREEALQVEQSSFDVRESAVQAKIDKLNRVYQEQELVEDRINKQRTILEEKRLEIEGKLLELAELEKEAVLIKQREDKVNEKLRQVAEKEAIILKEKKLARERKEQLDFLEEDLKRKQAKVQKFLNT